MNSMHTSRWLVMGLLAAAASAGAQQAPPTQSVAASVGVLAYPAKGQTAAQQTTDETECYDWSKTQSGYDPKAPPPRCCSGAGRAGRKVGSNRRAGEGRGTRSSRRRCHRRSRG
jgi:hypothetical protein